MKDEVNKTLRDEISSNNIFKQNLYQIYDNYFTSDELKQMVEFYSSAVGKKLTKLATVIAKESMVAGQKFGES